MNMWLPDGQTLIYGIFGYPLKHSLSPSFQSYAFRRKDINAIYIPFEVSPENLETALMGAKALNIKGLNITIPHKESILKYVDEISEYVEKIGACNTLKFEDKIYAYNTDWLGFKKSIEPFIKSHKKALVLGAGGTTKAVLYAFEKMNIDVFLYNRTIEKAYHIKKHFNIEVIKNIEDSIECVDIIVNTTSVGLKDEDKDLFDYNKIKEYQIVFDVIYKDTPLIKAAKQKNAVAINGFSMLIYQGMESFKIWTDIDLEDIKDGLFDIIKEKTGKSR